ncbi:HAD domain-containing protein [Nocardia sp. NPDC004654]|uniref:HAD domain-containing protein n=1 Tax=Nocardia sp. NPDC004654 TaxID=3154776 RepID=UPI0033A92FD8
MTDAPDRPLLFLDVDGPLIPFGGVHGHEAEPMPLRDGRLGSNPLATRLDSEIGRMLAALPCELVWATTWMHDANRFVGPILGLPTLTVMDWPDSPDDRIDEWFGLHWKTRALVERAAGRSFIWIDDEISASDREWIAEHHSGRALLHHVDPRTGLRPNDFDIIAAWLSSASSGVTARQRGVLPH